MLGKEVIFLAPLLLGSPLPPKEARAVSLAPQSPSTCTGRGSPPKGSRRVSMLHGHGGKGHPGNATRVSVKGWVTRDALPLSLPSGGSALTLFTLHRLSLQLKDPETSHLLQWPESEEELFLQSKKIQLRSLLSKIETVLQCFWQPLSQ